MPRDKDFKRLVRTRMKKTGEAYTAARAQLLNKPAARNTSAKVLDTATAKAKSADYADIAGMSDDAVQARTGRTWKEWVRVLDGDGADKLAHRDIAKIVKDTHGVGPWWSQMVTVGYERIKGLRDYGQRRDGAYEANKSRTFNVPVETLFDACDNAAMRRRFLLGTKVTVRSATKPRSMRLQLEDGAKVTLWFTSKGPGKSSLAVTQVGLPDRAAIDNCKQFWNERLVALAALLKGA